jgi:hypothetical protein
MNQILELQLKRDFVLKRLRNLNVTHSRDQVPIEKLSYRELKYELVLAELRQNSAEK